MGDGRARPRGFPWCPSAGNTETSTVEHAFPHTDLGVNDAITERFAIRPWIREGYTLHPEA